MATQAQVTAFSQRIFDAAMKGTPTNPQGLPVILSGLLVAQARHETGNFTSTHFIKSNNAFGYSYNANSVWQTGQKGGIADNAQAVGVYKTIEDSTREVVDWIFRRVKEGKFPQDLNSIATPEQYATYLKNAGYYGDTVENYTRGLIRYFADLPPTAGFGMLLLTAIVFYIFYRLTTKK